MATDEAVAVNCFDSLADEIIEQIFILKSLSYKDVCRLSCCCRRFNFIANGKEVWRNKACHRWSSWKHFPGANDNWKDVFKRRLKCEKDLTEKVSEIVKQSWKRECLQNKDLKYFADYHDAQDKESVVHIDNTFAAMLETDRFKDLTLKFYGRKIYTFIRQHELKLEWCSLLCKSEKPSHLIKGAILISQWCNPLDTIDSNAILRKIDEIAIQVRTKLKDNRRESQKEEIAILQAICATLSEELNFRGNSHNYYNVDNSFIDKVLEYHTGIPITLAILYASVAERLGLYLEPVNFPNHFLLRLGSSSSSDEVFIDAFNGKILTLQECLRILPPPAVDAVPIKTLFPTATAKQVFVRMMANIVRCHKSSTNIDISSLDKLRGALELMLLLSPEDEEHRLMLSRVYLHHDVNLDEVVENLQQLSSSSRGNVQTRLLAHLLEYALQRAGEETVNFISPKFRSDPENARVQYNVGMIMHHRSYHYFCVIYGWDNYCNMEEDWRNQMGIYNLSDGAEQAFYNVLADDGSSRYAAEENLAPLLKEGRPITNVDIGKYFNEFNGFQYIPNECLAKAYPEDGHISPHLLPANRYRPGNEAAVLA